MTDSSESRTTSRPNTNPPLPQSKLSQVLHNLTGNQDLREDYIGGMSGLNLAQTMVGIQAHKTMLDQQAKAWERANAVGWQGAGIDVDKLDEQIYPEDEDVNSSVNLSGDTTHIHMAPGAQFPGAMPNVPEPQAPNTNEAPLPSRRAPSWVKWALAGLIGTGAGAAASGLTAYLLKGDETNVTTPGGSVFRFETTKPEWMDESGP